MGKGGGTAMIFCRSGKVPDECLSEIPFLCRADYDPGEIPFLGDLLHDGTVAIGRPALCRSVLRTWADSNAQGTSGGLAGGKGSWISATQPPDHGQEFRRLMPDGMKLVRQRHSLIHQISATVGLPSHPAGNPCKKDLDGAPLGIRKKDRHVLWPRSAQNPRDLPRRGFFGEGEDLVDSGDFPPEGGNVLRCQKGDPGIGSARLDRPHGGDGHAGVAKPVRGADHDPERVEGLDVRAGREVNASLRTREKEVGMGDLPAVVNPEPILG